MLAVYFINIVGDKFKLPNSWLNADFIYTDSYSPKISEFSVRYRQFSNVLNVRVLPSEYLIAMKLRSGRQYKKDLSDIVGILREHYESGLPLTMEDINRAVCNLYGNWDNIPADSISFLKDTLENSNFEESYQKAIAEEDYTRGKLKEFERDYPNVINTENLDDILKKLKLEEQESQ